MKEKAKELSKAYEELHEEAGGVLPEHAGFSG